MNKTLLSISVGALALANAAFATTIVDNSTAGMYVDLGQVLDGTSALFPIANVAGGDPVIDIPVPEVEGATFSRGETRTSGEVVATVPAEAFLPWAFGKHDDLTAWADQFVLSTASLDA